jgi:hypothetical protein
MHAQYVQEEAQRSPLDTYLETEAQVQMKILMGFPCGFMNQVEIIWLIFSTLNPSIRVQIPVEPIFRIVSTPLAANSTYFVASYYG